MDDVDLAQRRERTIKVHVADMVAMRRIGDCTYVQRCLRCGMRLRSWTDYELTPFVMYSEEVEKFGLPGGTMIAISEDSQYVVTSLGSREEFCS